MGYAFYILGEHLIQSLLNSYDAEGGIIIEQKTWTMCETFCFPGYGCPTEIASVEITPQWQAKQLEDSLRLIGIYHVTAHVRFDFQEVQAFQDGDDLIKIDALDLQGDTGYFEYAVPLHVDLPKEALIDHLMVKDIRPSLNDQTCQLEWTITSAFSEPEQEREDKLQTAHVALQQLEPKQPVVEESPIAAAPPSPPSEPELLPVKEKAVLTKESPNQIVIRESSSLHEVPTMIWDLEENYTLLKVRASNDVIR